MSIVNWDSEDGEIRHCVLQKDEQGFGLQITGGNPVIVKYVSEGGAADREGVRVGDKIIKVNGTFVANSSHQEVVDLIKASNRVSLIVNSSCRSSPPPSSLPPPTSAVTVSTLKRNGSMIRGKHTTLTSGAMDAVQLRRESDGSLLSLANALQRSSSSAAIFDSRRKRQGRRKSVYASADEAVASLREEAKVICQKMNDMAMRELKAAQAKLLVEPSPENQVAASQAFVKLERLRSGETTEDSQLTPPTMMEVGSCSNLDSAGDRPDIAGSPILLHLHVDRAINDQNLYDSAKSDNKNSSSFDSSQFSADSSSSNQPIVRFDEASSEENFAMKNIVETIQHPAKSTMSFNLQMAVKNLLPNNTTEADLATTPTRDGNFQVDTTSSTTTNLKQDLFRDFITIRQFPARLGIVINYLLKKGERDHSKYLLFYIVVEHFKYTVGKNDVSQITRRWAVEIYTSFLTATSPVHLKVAGLVLEPLAEKFSFASHESTEKPNWSALFDAIILSLMEHFELAVRQFRQIFNTGLNDVTGMQAVTPNMGVEATVNLLEPLFVKLLRKFTPKEETMRADQCDANIVFCQALRTAMHFWNIPMRDASLQFRTTESIGSHGLLDRVILRAALSFNSSEEVRGGGGAGQEKQRRSMLGSALFSGGKSKAEKLEKKKVRDGVHWRFHLFTDVRIESLHHCHVCEKLLCGLPPQGWQCQYCSLMMHIECKETLNGECVNNKKESAGSLNFSNFTGSVSLSYMSKRRMKLSTSKDGRPAIEVIRDNDLSQTRMLSAKDPTPSSVTLEEPLLSASPLDEDCRPSATVVATIAPGYVMNMRNQFESSASAHLNNESLVTGAKSSDSAEKERLAAKGALLNRANSLRDGVGPNGFTVAVQPRANSDTPQHSNEIAEARRENDLATTNSSLSSGATYSDKSLASAPSMDSIINGSNSTLNSLTSESLSPSTNSTAAAAYTINEEDLNNDEDLRLPSGLDEYKHRFDVDAKLMNMNKDLRDYQYHLHEIIATEMGHVRSLKILQVLYAKRWPPSEQEFKSKIGLQHIEPILKVHRNLMQKLEQEVLKSQYLEKNFIITDIFRVLLEWYSVSDNVMQFKRYGASFGSKQGEVLGQKAKNKPDTNFAEIEDYIKKNARSRTPFWKFLDQSDRHPLMEKRRFQDIINIECQRQMRLAFLVSQAHYKLKKVKDKFLIGKHEASNLKEVEKITRSVLSYLDQEVTWLKEYSKMDLSRYEPPDQSSIFTRENIIFNLHIMYLHREADVRVTSLHAPTKGRKKEQNMKLLWLEDYILFIVKDESTGALCLKSIEASSTGTENPEQNIKASPIIQLRHVVTGSCSQPPEMKLFWYQTTTHESDSDAILLAVSIVFEKSQRAVEFKDAFSKAPKAPIPRKITSVGRSRHPADRFSSDVSGMFSLSKSSSTIDMSLVVDATKEEQKVDDVVENMSSSERTLEYVTKARESISTCGQILKDGFLEQSLALSRVLRIGQPTDLEHITDLLAAQNEPFEDVQDVLLVAHRQTAQISSHLSSAMFAAAADDPGSSSNNSALCSSLRKLRRQVVLLQSFLQASKLGMESDEDEESGADLAFDDATTSTPKSAADAAAVDLDTISSEAEDPDAQNVSCAPPVDEEIPTFSRAKYFTTRSSVPPLLSSTEELEEDMEQQEVENRLPISQIDLDRDTVDQTETHKSDEVMSATNSNEDGNCLNRAADADSQQGSSVEEDASSVSSVHSGSSVIELGETELWEHLVCEIDRRTLDEQLDERLPALENLATTCDVADHILIGCDGVDP